MKRKLIALLAFLTVSVFARAATPDVLTVAVYDFTDTDKNAGGYASKVTTLVTANLTTETNLVMLERAALTKALNEQAFGVSGMVSSDAAAKIGQITGAKVLVAGQVIKTGANHLVVVANIIGTETGRLFAPKVEGPADNLMDLASELSRKIAQTISDQRINLITATRESSAERLDRIIKGLNGTNRPSVSVSIHCFNPKSSCASVETEFGIILLKAGFVVVDGNSDRKPDVEITGLYDSGVGPHQGGLYSRSSVIDLKVQERRSGNIITVDHQESTATEAAVATAYKISQVNAADALAERILPLLAK